MENLHTLQHQQQQDRSMGNFFDTPDPAKASATPPPFAPTAQPTRLDGSFMPYYSPKLANAMQPGGPQKEVTTLTPTHPGQGQPQKAITEVPKSTQPLRISGAGVGLKAPNTREDVLATMQALSQLGYPPSVQEYQAVQQTQPGQPIPSEHLNSFVAQITAYQKANMKIGGGYGNIQSGGITHNTINKGLAKAQTQQQPAKPHQGVPLTKANQATETESTGNPLYSPALNQALSYNQTPTAPPVQAGIPSNSSKLTLTHNAVGDKAKNYKDDVLRTMEALAYAGYKTDYCEYEAVQKHEPADQPIPLDQLPNFISQIHRFQKDQKMGSDGNITQGKDTMKKLNAAIEKKVAADPAMIKKREEEEAAKRENKANEAIAKNTGPEGDKAMANELLQGFKTDFEYFKNLLCKMQEKAAKDTEATPPPKLLRQMMMRLLAEDWFTANSKKDPEFKAKVQFLRNEFINAAQQKQENQQAPQYTPEILYLDNLGVQPDQIFNAYGEIEENAAVQVIKHYMPTLALLKKQSTQLGQDCMPTPESMEKEKTYKTMLKELGQSQVLYIAFYSPQLAVYQKEGYKEVMDDMMAYVATNGAPVQNGYRKEMEMNLLTLLKNEDEVTRDYILGRMAQKAPGSNTSPLATIQKGNEKGIQSQFGDEGNDHLTQIQKAGTKEGLKAEWEQNPTILIEQYPEPKTLAPKLVELLTKQPQMYHKVRPLLSPENAGRTAYRFFMQVSEAGKAATIPSGVYCDMVEDIQSGRETWWTDLEKKTYPKTLDQIQEIAGLQTQKNQTKVINQKGEEAANDPYWLHQKMNGDMNRIADHIGTKLPSDTKAFDALLQAQGQLQGPEYEKDLFHRIVIGAMTDERIWGWGHSQLEDLKILAQKRGITDMVQTLSKITHRNAQIDKEQKDFGYEGLESQENKLQTDLMDLEAQKAAILNELSVIAPERYQPNHLQRGMATYLGEGVSFKSTETVHWPGNPNSGVTIGKGFDLGQKKEESLSVLSENGVPENIVGELKYAVNNHLKGGLKDGEKSDNPKSAEGFVNYFKAKYPTFKLEPHQQKAIFSEVFKTEENTCIDFLCKGDINWKGKIAPSETISPDQYHSLPDDLKQFLTDLKFQAVLKPDSEYPLQKILSILKTEKSHEAIRQQFISMTESAYSGQYPRRAIIRWLLLTKRELHPDAIQHLQSSKASAKDLPTVYETWKAKWDGKSYNTAIEQETKNTQDPTQEKELNIDQLSDEEFINLVSSGKFSPKDAEQNQALNDQLSKKFSATTLAQIKEKEEKLAALNAQIEKMGNDITQINEQKEAINAIITRENQKTTDQILSKGAQVVDAYTTDGKTDVKGIVSTILTTAILEPETAQNIYAALPAESRTEFINLLVNDWSDRGMLPYISPATQQWLIHLLEKENPSLLPKLTASDTASKEACDRDELHQNSLSKADGFIYGPWLTGIEHFVTQAAPGDRRDGVNGLTEDEAAKRGGYKSSCGTASNKMLAVGGFEAKSTLRYGLIDGSTNEINPNFKEALSILDQNLSEGKPVLAGVDKGVTGENDYDMNDGTKTATDHFIVIVGKGKDEKGIFYAYFDPARSGKEGYDLAQNRFYLDGNSNFETEKIHQTKKITDYAYSDIYYNLSEIRPTK